MNKILWKTKNETDYFYYGSSMVWGAADSAIIEDSTWKMIEWFAYTLEGNLPVVSSVIGSGNAEAA